VTAGRPTITVSVVHSYGIYRVDRTNKQTHKRHFSLYLVDDGTNNEIGNV